MTMMSRLTGKPIEDRDHLMQSIADILTTWVGSRVGIREYGCRLLERIDQNINRNWLINAIRDIAEALYRWEPRVRVYKITIDTEQAPEGIIGITLVGVYLPDGKPIRIDNLQLNLRQSGIAQDALLGTRTV